MDKICKTCAADPESHSFKKISEKRGVSIFYTKPSNAKLYKDTEGILAHLDNTLAQLGNKKWVFIIDGDGFDIRHATEISTGLGILKLINKYLPTLVELKLINPSWHMKGAMKLAESEFTEELKSKITLIDDRVSSVLQFM